MEEPLIITFGMPHHGWLPVKFSAGTVNLEFDASDVVNDPLNELYISLRRLIEHKTGEVTWWLEPYTYFFYFERTGPDEFRLTISEADDIEGKRELLTVLDGSYKQMLAPMRKALLKFCDFDYEETHWPFFYNKSDIENLPKIL